MRERPFVLPFLVLVLVMGLSRPPPAHADVAIDVTLGEGAQDLADDLGIDVDELRTRARDAIAAGLNLVDVRAYLQSFGDGTSFAARGTGVDYASNSELFTFGVAAGVGVDLEGVANDNDFSAGVGGTFTNNDCTGAGTTTANAFRVPAGSVCSNNTGRDGLPIA